MADDHNRQEESPQLAPLQTAPANVNMTEPSNITRTASSDAQQERFPQYMEGAGGSSSGQFSRLGDEASPGTAIRRSEGDAMPTIRNLPAKVVPQSRNRGYSLRRSLFAHNVQKQQGDHGSAMEMGSSSTSPTLTEPQEKGPTVITIEEPELGGPTNDAARHRSVTIVPWSQPSKKSWSHISHGVASLHALKDRFLGPSELPPTADGRHVQINVNKGLDPLDERTGKPYISNKIRSCKYTLWNFVPKQLVAQFGKLANFYFLVIAVLQMIPDLSTTGNYTTIVPLLIFVSISMAKEGYEDVRRARLDKEENESLTYVLNEAAYHVVEDNDDFNDTPRSSSKAWTKTKWQDIKVGDVVLLERDSALPADIVLLYSWGLEGAAYIETKSLDGETNLKCKKALEPISQCCARPSGVARLQADFVVEDPNLDLYKFEGRVKLGSETFALGLNEVIYRGSILRNTPNAIGLVVYSGEECKIRMNANKNPRVKAPTLQFKVNRVVIIVACLVLFIAVILSIGHVIWKRTTENGLWYLHEAHVPFSHILVSFVIMLNTMLPLSLYVSLEIIKVAQMFMMADIDLYDPVSDRGLEAKTSTLNEELGQVSYLFSDKTGTLTNNEMKFRKMSIAGSAWLHDQDLLQDAEAAGELKLRHKKRSGKSRQKKGKAKHKRGESQSPLAQASALSSQATETYASKVEAFSRTGRTDELLEYIHRHPHRPFARKVRFFILAMALCHTCIPEKDGEGDITFQAASPDELALVTAAQELGFTVTDRQSKQITVKTYPQDETDEPVFETYQILDVIEFSSARKRMSIVVRFPDGRICLFTKGADSTLRQLLRQADLATMYVEDIRRKSEARKSMEVQAVLQRRSAQFSRKSIGSPGACRQSSVSLARRPSMRQSVDLWLREREASSAFPRKSSVHYTPRPSESVAPRGPSLGRISADSRRLSFQTDDLEDLVDEAMVVNDAAVFQRCFNHIDDFATEGLRTLVYGHRFIPAEEYEKWKDINHAAATSLVDRQEKIERAAELIEQKLELTGATAIEDKLQAGVPDAIERFRRAGIKMWMLTGDKRETAINIGHSCRLIKDYSHMMVLDQAAGHLAENISKFMLEVSSGRHAHCVLVVDGQTLTVINGDPRLKLSFTDLVIAIDSVICCRASPSQKAGLVKTIRTKVKDSVTLAIGDGANDVAMIQEAHLGIGIAGKEGLQAARSSDYSIAQFRFLLKLLLVHGRWNYVRVCKYTLGTFWKEMFFYLAQATFQRWNGYTGTSLYESWSLSMFNTLFTSLPVIFMGVFEKDLAPATLLAVPELYSYGQQNRGFNILRYIRWAVLGAVQSQIVYFTMHSIFGEAKFTTDNRLFAMGVLVFTACVTLISLKIQVFELHNKSVMSAIAIFLSVGGWWLWNLILSEIYHPRDPVYNVRHGVTRRFGRNPLWWLTLILIVLSVSMLEIVIKSIKSVFFPTDVETFQILERDLEVKKRFEESAADLMQQGWNRGTKKSSLEIAREEEEQARREAEIQDILDRPRTMDLTDARTGELTTVGIRKRQSWQPVDFEMVATEQGVALAPANTRHSMDMGELFSKGFGMVRKESMK